MQKIILIVKPLDTKSNYFTQPHEANGWVEVPDINAKAAIIITPAQMYWVPMDDE